jgi:hypothetical protein
MEASLVVAPPACEPKLSYQRTVSTVQNCSHQI